MERIKFIYEFDDTTNSKTDEFNIEMTTKSEDGLLDHEVCETFEAFMRAIGFSEQNIANYFRSE